MWGSCGFAIFALGPAAHPPMPLAYKLFKESGERDYGAEKRLNEIALEADAVEKQALKLAQMQQMLGDIEHVPSTDIEARERYQAAQRRAAGMSDEVLSELRNLMFNASRPTVKLEAAKALWEIASRIMGGDGKAGPLPGVNVLVVDKGDFQQEMQRRRQGSRG